MQVTAVLVVAQVESNDFFEVRIMAAIWVQILTAMCSSVDSDVFK